MMRVEKEEKRGIDVPTPLFLINIIIWQLIPEGIHTHMSMKRVQSEPKIYSILDESVGRKKPK